MKHHHSAESMIAIRNDFQWQGDTRLGAISAYVDGRFPGDIWPGEELQVPVTQGRHTVRVRFWWYFSPKVTVHVQEAGSWVYLRADFPRSTPLPVRVLKATIMPLHSLVLEETEQAASY